MPPAQAIPGITSQDEYPRACVDCHIYYPDMDLDARLSTVMSRWSEAVEPEMLLLARAVAEPDAELTGVHPRAEFALDDIPTACLRCHDSGPGNVVPLSPFLHRVHLDESGQAVYLRLFRGECTHCHKLDKDAGRWRIPSAAER